MTMRAKLVKYLFFLIGSLQVSAASKNGFNLDGALIPIDPKFFSWSLQKQPTL